MRAMFAAEFGNSNSSIQVLSGEAIFITETSMETSAAPSAIS